MSIRQSQWHLRRIARPIGICRVAIIRIEASNRNKVQRFNLIINSHHRHTSPWPLVVVLIGKEGLLRLQACKASIIITRRHLQIHLSNLSRLKRILMLGEIPMQKDQILKRRVSMIHTRYIKIPKQKKGIIFRAMTYHKLNLMMWTNGFSRKMVKTMMRSRLLK